MRTLLPVACAILLLAGCSERYVGPGSGTRKERLQKREQQHAESTEVVAPPVVAPQLKRDIEDSGLPVAP